MRRDLESAERHMSPATKRLMHRHGWIIQLASSLGFLGFGVAGFFRMISTNPIIAIAWTAGCWAATWFIFTLALRTRARRGEHRAIPTRCDQ